VDDPRLDSLVHRWEDAYQRGQDLTAAELCGDCPELRTALEQHIALLRALLRGESAAPPTQPPVIASNTSSAPATGGATLPYVPGDPAPPPAPPGYEIVGVLGQGGMGVVYLARQVRLLRTVALKMLRGGAPASKLELAVFKAEAVKLARAEHPNIVPVYDVGESDGQPYFAMEYVEGGSLAGRLREALPEPWDAARIVEKIAVAVQAAHERGIVHRDLKPANVLLTPAGVPKVSDFGVAKGLDFELAEARIGVTMSDDDVAMDPAKLKELRRLLADRETMVGDDTGARRVSDRLLQLMKEHDAAPRKTTGGGSGRVVGTPPYMAPEQAAGRPVGPAADVYALGAILYECFTGRPPFKAATAPATLDLVIHSDPVPVRAINPHVPKDLETVCHKCLRKEPAERYASADELAADLRRFLEGQPVEAQPVGTAEPVAGPARRNRAVASLLGAVAVALVIATIVSATYAVRTSEAVRLRDEAIRRRAETAVRLT
jgi:serine/threonine protein kinase